MPGVTTTFGAHQFQIFNGSRNIEVIVDITRDQINTIHIAVSLNLIYQGNPFIKHRDTQSYFKTDKASASLFLIVDLVDVTPFISQSRKSQLLQELSRYKFQVNLYRSVHRPPSYLVRLDP